MKFLYVKFSLLVLATSLGLAQTVVAQDTAVCDAAAGTVEEIAERLDKMSENPRRARMGVVMIGTSAAIAAAYATDAGWDDEDIAPMAALRDAREPDADGQTMPAEDALIYVHAQGQALTGVLQGKCPDTPLVDLPADAPEIAQ